MRDLRDYKQLIRVLENGYLMTHQEMSQVAEIVKELKAEKQEPVAYKYTDKTNPLVFYFTELKGKDVTQNPDVIETALYTAPPKREWVGLTDDEIALYDKRLSGSNVARDIETKLKEKNGG